MDLLIENCDFPKFFVCLPEGTHIEDGYESKWFTPLSNCLSYTWIQRTFGVFLTSLKHLQISYVQSGGLTPHFMIFLACVQPNYNWLVVLTILKTLVSWDYYSRYMENTPNVPNHPPDIDLDISIVE